MLFTFLISYFIILLYLKKSLLSTTIPCLVPLSVPDHFPHHLLIFNFHHMRKSLVSFYPLFFCRRNGLCQRSVFIFFFTIASLLNLGEIVLIFPDFSRLFKIIYMRNRDFFILEPFNLHYVKKIKNNLNIPVRLS